MRVPAREPAGRKSARGRLDRVTAIVTVAALSAAVAIVALPGGKQDEPLVIRSKPALATTPAKAPPARPAENEPDRAQPLEPAKVEGAIETLLSPPAKGPAPDLQAISKRVGTFGPSAVPIVIAILCGEMEMPEYVPGTKDEPVHPLAIERQQDVLIQSLRTFRLEDVVRELRSKGTGGTENPAPLETRLVVARLLGEVPSVQSFDALLDVIAGIEPIHLMRAYVQGTLEEALAACLAADSKCYERLAKQKRSAADALVPVLLRSLGRTCNAASIQAIAGFLGRSSVTDTVAIEQLGKVVQSSGLALPEFALSDVRRLMDHPAAGVKRSAAELLGRVGDRDSFEALLQRVGGEDRVLSGVALWSLKQMTRADLGLEREAWIQWHEREQAWWTDAAPPLLEQLSGEDPGVVLAAMRQLSRRPLFRHDVAAAIGPLVLHDDVDLSRQAIQSLQQLRSPHALPWLMRALEKTDARRTPAHKALLELTRLDLPPDCGAWSRALPIDG